MTDFEEVYRRYYKAVYLYILGISGDESIAGDITADTFFKALKGIEKFNGKCDIRVWLCQIAKNTFYNRCKKQKKLTGEDVPETVSDGFVLEEQLEDDENAMKIHELLHTMDEPYKEVFTLRVFGELSFRQIGAIFGKSESWARVTYHRARLKLIDKMEE
ncbi:MAG: RNA polymerase sigma factor [Porcipelethomonas sp.]